MGVLTAHDPMCYKALCFSNGPQNLQATYSHHEPHSSFDEPLRKLLGGIQSNM